MEPPPRLRPGPQPGFLGWLNKLRDYLVSITPYFDPGHFEVFDYSGGIGVRVKADTDLVIELTANLGGGQYSWRRVYRDPAVAGGWAEDAFDSGDAADPAVEANGNSTVPLSTLGHPTRVQAARSPDTGEILFQADNCI